MTLRIERYRHSRHWAVYDGETLVVVTLYKRGAQEVLRRLAAQPLARVEAAAQAAAVEVAAQQALARRERRAADAASPAWPRHRAATGQAGRRRDQRERHGCGLLPEPARFSGQAAARKAAPALPLLLHSRSA